MRMLIFICLVIITNEGQVNVSVCPKKEKKRKRKVCKTKELYNVRQFKFRVNFDAAECQFQQIYICELGSDSAEWFPWFVQSWLSKLSISRWDIDIHTSAIASMWNCHKVHTYEFQNQEWRMVSQKFHFHVRQNMSHLLSVTFSTLWETFLSFIHTSAHGDTSCL